MVYAPCPCFLQMPPERMFSLLSVLWPSVLQPLRASCPTVFSCELWFFDTHQLLSWDPSPPLTQLGSTPTWAFSLMFPGRYTYEIAPVFVLMEEEVLKKLRALVGWNSGDGVFCPGM